MNSKKLIANNEQKVRETVLTDEEFESAILEGKRKKYFKEKNRHYWNDESNKTSDRNGIQKRP